MTIRPANFTTDASGIWDIISITLQSGDTWVFDPASSKEKMLDYWFQEDKFTYVCEIKGKVAGTFFFKANQPDLGNHIANAGYMVHPAERGQGIAEAMCRFSLIEAKKKGFLAMQFNIVIATNLGAIRIWEKCGFQKIGLLPKVFRHQSAGLVDAWVMFQEL